jgi:hypothetical protein
VYVLIGLAILELGIIGIAVPLTAPAKGKPPHWQTQLDYAGVFLLYFTGALATVLLFQRVLAAFRQRRDVRTMIAHALVAVATVLAATKLFVTPGDNLKLVIELALALAVIALVISAVGVGRDLGAVAGTVILAIPLLIHTFVVVAERFLWPENTFDGPTVSIRHGGVLALSLAALASPYVFAPRPFARAVTRPIPVLFAMTVAAAGALIARTWYPQIAKVSVGALGIELAQGRGDPRMSIYLLAIATLAWTLASCFLARATARREIGAGIALVALGAHVFKYAHHYLLPLLGIALIADAVARVRNEEATELPLSRDAPTIGDAAWQRYVTALAQGLRRTLSDVHSLTTRGEGGLVSSLIVGEKAGLGVRTRIERVDGVVIGLDVVVGREIDEGRGATLSLWAMPVRGNGPNPAGPPAAPVFKSGDTAFDQRFKSRGSALVFNRLFDDGLRARAVATLDGWLAYWEPEGLRYRVYPGRGAPLDHPMPLSDLALDRPAAAERLIAVIELLVELGARGIKPASPAERTDVEGIAVDEPTDVVAETVDPAADPTVEAKAFEE